MQDDLKLRGYVGVVVIRVARSVFRIEDVAAGAEALDDAHALDVHVAAARHRERDVLDAVMAHDQGATLRLLMRSLLLVEENRLLVCVALAEGINGGTLQPARQRRARCVGQEDPPSTTVPTPRRAVSIALPAASVGCATAAGDGKTRGGNDRRDVEAFEAAGGAFQEHRDPVLV